MAHQPVEHALSAYIGSGETSRRSQQPLVATGEHQAVDVSRADPVLKHADGVGCPFEVGGQTVARQPMRVARDLHR